MIFSYITIALRNLFKHKLFALINIIGLTLGLLIFMFSVLLAGYEKNHDHMFDKRERIFTLASKFAPTSGEAIGLYPDSATAYGPLIRARLPELEAVARAVHRIKQFTVDNNSYYLGARFVDSDFTRIFNFTYIHGDASALDHPNGLILTRSFAERLFGRADVLGRQMKVEQTLPLQVTAVIEDIAPDSHLNSDMRPKYELGVIASYRALTQISKLTEEGEMGNNSAAIYVLLPTHRDRAWLQQEADAMFDKHTPDEARKSTEALRVRPLIMSNTMVWDALGFPVLIAAQVLGLMILIIAALNYTNLAAAQSLGRIREVGLRKALGASRKQLLQQFLIESLTLASFSMLLALAAIEWLVPLYNSGTGKAVDLNYAQILPYAIGVTLLVGLGAGAYPAYQISRHHPIECLRGAANGAGGKQWFRNILITAQFSLSIFMLAMVMVVYFQNQKIQELSSSFNKNDTLVLERLDIDGIVPKQKALKQQLLNQEGVAAASLSSAVPFHSAGHYRDVSKQAGDEAGQFDIAFVSVDFDYLLNYRQQLLAGRWFDEQRSQDVFEDDRAIVNVIVNQRLLDKLGISRADAAIGQTFYKIYDEKYPKERQYQIIGVVADSYFFGVHQPIPPTGFMVRPQTYKYLSVHLVPEFRQQGVLNTESTWKSLIPNYPIQSKFLDYYFRLFYRIAEGINAVITGFAGIALMLSLIGLFGLAAFMAQRRTREIGIRKVLGASLGQVISLLVWQISKPVLWSVLLAVPLSYLAAGLYIDFYPEAIRSILPFVAFAVAIAVLMAWSIVAVHAWRVARQRPVQSLRYE
ncbi:ABC transporter permease [Pseudoteredinibacter isoporae]|uniref:ABC transporter permease n=1 Tax=Pseudoteredinibacter isoporae TaxID=570281 RepID=UPI003101ECBE